MTMHPLPPAVVLGQGFTALGVLQSLGPARIEMFLACPNGDIAGSSRWARGRRVDLTGACDGESLVRALERFGIHEAVLFPCTDVWAEAVARIPDSARGRYRSSPTPPGVLAILVDKALFADALDRHGIPHPTTRRVTVESDFDVAELEGFFLKPSHSGRFQERFKKKALTFADSDGARAGVAAMTDAGVDALLQEYIPGPSSNHYFVDGFVDAKGVFRAVFVRRRLRMYPPAFGNSSLMVTVSRESARAAVDDLMRLLSGIGYRGIFSAEFKQDARDDRFKLLEVNARPWWYIGFAAQCGVDVSTLAYRDALGDEIETIESYPAGIRCVAPHLDLRAYLSEHPGRVLGPARWARSIAGARLANFTWSDPLPSLKLLFIGARKRWRGTVGRSRMPDLADGL